MRAKAAATRGTARDSGHRAAATLLLGSGAWGLEGARGHPSEAFVGEVVRAGLVGGRAAAPQGPSPPNTNSFLRPVPGAGLGSGRAVSGGSGARSSAGPAWWGGGGAGAGGGLSVLRQVSVCVAFQLPCHSVKETTQSHTRPHTRAVGGARQMEMS